MIWLFNICTYRQREGVKLMYLELKIITAFHKFSVCQKVAIMWLPTLLAMLARTACCAEYFDLLLTNSSVNDSNYNVIKKNLGAYWSGNWRDKIL